LIGLQLGIGYVIAAPGINPKKRIYPDVLKVEVRKTAKGVFSFDVTILSPDTGWKKYANAFRVKAIKGRILGTRILYHPHVNEQPFTRALSGVKIPPDLQRVLVEARDSVEGWGGRSQNVKIPH
jgi:hypothetical protein